MLSSKKKIAILPILGIIGGALSGCAKGPAGGPVTPVSNYMTVTMTLQQAANPSFFYYFAFDDDADPTDGPAAIIGTTQLTNGVVAGAFTVLVQARGGTFQAFRRTALAGGTEQLERCSTAFVGVPSVSGNTIRFTLNLDAKLDADATQRLFVTDPQRLDFNFVTTSEIIRAPDDLREKPFDALGSFPGAPNEFAANVDVSSTRTYRNADTLREPTNDANRPPFSAITDAQLAQLDIVNFTLDVRRS